MKLVRLPNLRFQLSLSLRFSTWQNPWSYLVHRNPRCCLTQDLMTMIKHAMSMMFIAMLECTFIVMIYAGRGNAWEVRILLAVWIPYSLMLLLELLRSIVGDLLSHLLTCLPRFPSKVGLRRHPPIHHLTVISEIRKEIIIASDLVQVLVRHKQHMLISHFLSLSSVKSKQKCLSFLFHSHEIQMKL